MGAMNIGQASPYVEAFSIARAAAAAVFTVIDRIPEIDSFSEEGAKPINAGPCEVFKNNNSSIHSTNKINGDVHDMQANEGTQELHQMKPSQGWINSGNIVFDNVYFNYPSRPDVKVCLEICVEIKML